jgi:membrane protein implicated in regulation of membrane protease activity
MPSIDNSVWVWLVIAIILGLAELTFSGLVLIWSAIGALLASIVAVYAPNNLVLQILVFLGFSVLLILLTRPISKKILNKNSDQSFNPIGKIARVLECTDEEENMYDVMLDSEVWRATSNNKLKKDQKVKVTAISGNKLIVE